MSETIIPFDPAFANKIDANCNSCLEDGDRTKQLLNLRNRGERSPHPGEKKALKRYVEKCGHCFKQGRKIIDSLEATRSCDYRVGIESSA